MRKTGNQDPANSDYPGEFRYGGGHVIEDLVAGKAVNLTERTIYTYMGALKPNLGNASYSTSGQLSPLLKDPYFKTIGIGTRIFPDGVSGFCSVVIAFVIKKRCVRIKEKKDKNIELC